MPKIAISLLVALLWAGSALGQETAPNVREALLKLQAQVERLGTQLEAQRGEIAAQRAEIEQLRRAAGMAAAPAGPAAALAAPAAPAPSVSVSSLQPQQARTEAGRQAPLPSLGGFKFSGDFRLRFDASLRSGNAAAPPLENVRGRYRILLNADKQLEPRFDFHLQLATGALDVPTTNDQDMGGMNVKHPFSVSEVWVDFHPTRNFSMRAGRMSDVFTERSRFIFDDDVRFDGFQQVARLPLARRVLGFNALEFRCGEYILSNPNIQVLPASSPLVATGAQPGKNVRDSMLFHPGFSLTGTLKPGWSQRFFSDVELYRNPNQIQLASTSVGPPLLINSIDGLVLSGTLRDRGNATTSPDRTRYFASHFQIVRVAYRVDHEGWRLGRREVPAWLDVRAARNFGTSTLRDAFAVLANLGNVRQAGDLRFLYEFAIKDANSIISQFTDDDLGTGAGVNIAVHGLRFDLGLARFLQWQNMLFIQNPRRASNPAEHLFVSVPRGANTTFRFLSQLDFVF